MKRVLISLLALLLITSVSATFGYDDGENIGNFKQNICFDLPQTCGNCTFNNVTSIQYSNGTRIEIDSEMTKDVSFYNYTHCFPDLSGIYAINGVGDDDGLNNSWNYKLTLSKRGVEPTISQAIMHSIIFFSCLLFLGVSLFGAVKIDGRNEFQMGKILKVNFNKYIKQGLFFISYLFLIFTSGMAWVLSENYLNFDIGTKIFETIFQVLWILLFPIFLIFVSVSLIKFVIDLRLENLRVRNLPMR